MATTDDDDDNDDDDDGDDSKSGKSEKHHNWRILDKKYQKVVLLTKNTKTTQILKKNGTQADQNRHESVKAISGTNKIIKDYHENCLNVSKMASTYSNVVRNIRKILCYLSTVSWNHYV